LFRQAVVSYQNMASMKILKSKLIQMIRNGSPVEDVQYTVEQLQEHGMDDFTEFYDMAVMTNKVGRMRGELDETVEYLQQIC
jgi:hypothetical protein